MFGKDSRANYPRVRGSARISFGSGAERRRAGRDVLVHEHPSQREAASASRWIDGQGARTRRSDDGGAGIGDEPQHGDRGQKGYRGRARALRTRPAGGRGPSPADRRRSRPSHQLGRSRRARCTWRPHVDAALDAQVHPPTGQGPDRHGPSGLVVDRWPAAPPDGLQPSGNGKDGRRSPAPRP